MLLGASLATSGRHADADPPRVHASAGVAHAVGAPQSDQFGFGGAGALALELPVAKALGIQAELSTIVLSAGDRTDVGVRPKSTGFTFGGMLGARLRPMPSRPGGLWIDANVGGLTAGDSVVPGFDAHVGWDFRVGKGRFDVGPLVGYTHMFDVGSSPVPGDAHVPWVGVQFGLGAPAEARRDRDRDSVFDDEDACPDTPGIRTQDPRANGCPHQDGDKDGIFDDEDACPSVPGIRTTDPKTNGCPRQDRDKDTVFDDEDACPDVPGLVTTDPKTNGCPRQDRDKDTVFDDEDACPDVPGLVTKDPKTNGCPASEGNVRVEGDQVVLGEVILFDTDSIRVRHVSWPLVKRVADILRANPDILEVNIEGHSDQTGEDGYNVALSKARAESVKKLLVRFGVAEARMTTHAFGNTRPRVEGSTKEQLHQNRRVEFYITRTNASKLGGKP